MGSTAQQSVPYKQCQASLKCLVIRTLANQADTQSRQVDSTEPLTLHHNNRDAQGTFQRLIGSLLTLGAFLSSLVAGAFAHFFGRKSALWIACVLNAIACIIQISTTDKVAVYIGRLVLGLANGFLVTFSNIYGKSNTIMNY